MRYAIDLDGVVANFIRAFNKVALELWPGCLESIDVVPQHFWYKDLLHEDQVRAILSECRIRKNFWCGIEPYHEAVEAFRKISFWEHEFYFVSARSHSPGYPVSVQTRKWLWTRVGLDPDLFSVVIVKDSKLGVVRAIEADFSIDDKPSVVRGLSSLPNHYSWLLDRPYNRHAHDLDDFRVSSLDEFFRRAI